MRTLEWLAIASVVGASGCSSTHLEDLKTPVLVWTQDSGVCRKVVAVDGNRTVWTDTACEGDGAELAKIGTATQAQADDLWMEDEELIPSTSWGSMARPTMCRRPTAWPRPVFLERS